MCEQEPHPMSGETEVSCCCVCVSGQASVNVTINKTCFVPGELIYINGEVHNNTNSKYASATAIIEQVVCINNINNFNSSFDVWWNCRWRFMLQNLI